MECFDVGPICPSCPLVIPISQIPNHVKPVKTITASLLLSNLSPTFETSPCLSTCGVSSYFILNLELIPDGSDLWSVG